MHVGARHRRLPGPAGHGSQSHMEGDQFGRRAFEVRKLAVKYDASHAAKIFFGHKSTLSMFKAAPNRFLEFSRR